MHEGVSLEEVQFTHSFTGSPRNSRAVKSSCGKFLLFFCFCFFREKEWKRGFLELYSNRELSPMWSGSLEKLRKRHTERRMFQIPRALLSRVFNSFDSFLSHYYTPHSGLHNVVSWETSAFASVYLPSSLRSSVWKSPQAGFWTSYSLSGNFTWSSQVLPNQIKAHI